MFPDTEEGLFVVATGIGHCGTKWISELLTRPADGMTCHHELTFECLGVSWYPAMEKILEQGFHAFWLPYANTVAEDRHRHRFVGDSNMYIFPWLSDLEKELGIGRLIFLVRNGIQNIHSYFIHAKDIPGETWFFDSWIKNLVDRHGAPATDFGRLSRFEALCHLWACNVGMPAWTVEILGPERILVARLEDLVTDIDEAARAVQAVNPRARPSRRQLRKMQNTDTNRKIEGDRTPEALWSRWTDEQRDAFARICGPVMEIYRYPMP